MHHRLPWLVSGVGASRAGRRFCFHLSFRLANPPWCSHIFSPMFCQQFVDLQCAYVVQIKISQKQTFVPQQDGSAQ